LDFVRRWYDEPARENVIVDQKEWLTGQFEEHRPRLRGVAYRMLGSLAEADDAVQEAWLRLNRADAGAVENPGGWLTTVVSRVCLDMLRSRKSRREESIDAAGSVQPAAGSDPEQEALMADSVGLALLVVLDTLSPAERLAFVLHDLFAVPFEDIASIVHRTPEAARQLASRARRRVRGTANVSPADRASQRAVVSRLLAALRAGDVEGLVAVLDPDLVARVDAAAATAGRPVEVHGARTWATGAVAFARMAQMMELALVNGAVGLVLAPGGRLSRVVSVTIKDNRVSQIEIVADPDRLQAIDIAALD
jgi:RNA polymerase sigma-70 factor (ECF subfamily)